MNEKMKVQANPPTDLSRQPGLLGRAVLPQLLDIPEQTASSRGDVSTCFCNLQVSGSFVQQLWAWAKKNAGRAVLNVDFGTAKQSKHRGQHRKRTYGIHESRIANGICRFAPRHWARNSWPCNFRRKGSWHFYALRVWKTSWSCHAAKAASMSEIGYDEFVCFVMSCHVSSVRACPKVKTSSLHMVTEPEKIPSSFMIFTAFTTVSLSEVLRDLSGCRCFQPVPRCTTCYRYAFANSFLSSPAEWLSGGTCCVPASWTPATQMNSVLWVHPDILSNGYIVFWNFAASVIKMESALWTSAFRQTDFFNEHLLIFYWFSIGFANSLYSVLVMVKNKTISSCCDVKKLLPYFLFQTRPKDPHTQTTKIRGRIYVAWEQTDDVYLF